MPARKWPDMGLPEEVVARIAASVSKAVDATRVWIFGSRARGEAGPESDIDIFFTVAESDDVLVDMVEARGALLWLHGEGYSFDVLGNTDEGYESAKELIWPIDASVASEGVLIYERA